MALLWTIRRCLALATVCTALLAISTGRSQEMPAFSFEGYQGAVGTGAASELLRLPPIDEQAASTQQIETLPPPGAGSIAAPEVWQLYSTPTSAFDYYYGGKARGYYINDQRIEFTGEEATFAVEGVVAGGLRQQNGSWLLGLDTEIFLNQPFDRNIFQDTPERVSFAHN